MSFVDPEKRKRAFRRRRTPNKKLEPGETPKRAYKVPIDSDKVQFLVLWKKKKGSDDYREIYRKLARFCEVNEAWGYNACQKQIMKKGFYEDKVVQIIKVKFVK